MNESIDGLGEETVFLILDASSWYSQMGIDERDRDKTAFTSRHGFQRFTRMVFGLKNAPVTFQRSMGVILAYVHW